MASRLRIGIISELYSITTPPQKYGGIARIVHYLSEELVRRGYDVTLFALPGSSTSGLLVTVQAGDSQDGPRPPYVDVALSYVGDIDVWIDGSHHKRFARECSAGNVLCPSWNPNRADIPINPVLQSPHMFEQLGLKEGSAPCFFVGIPMPDPELRRLSDTIVSMNVMTAYKGVHRAVAAARHCGFDLELYGHAPDVKWYEHNVLRPAMQSDNISLFGLAGRERFDIFRRAAASISLVTWPEPGSLASIESMACGCPVIATGAGCFPYYIESGVNGVLTDSDPESVCSAMEAVLSAGEGMRIAAREFAEENFSLGKYVDEWEALFMKIMEGERW